MTFQKLNKIVLFVFIAALAVTTFGQKQVTGSWKAKYKEKQGDKIHISFYADDSDDDHRMGSSVKFERLQGLTKDQALAGGPVAFTLSAEAGNIDMNGTFENQRGKGTFVFTPDPSFASAVEGMGFERISSRKLFSSAVLDVKLSLVSELRNSGLRVSDYDDVFKATIFKVDAEYINEMSRAGFENLDMEGLIQGRIFKIDADYASKVIAMGFGSQSLDELVKFRIFKVTPEFLSEMKSEGYTNLTVEQVVQLRIFKITPEFIQEMRTKGHSNPTVEELVQLRIRGKID
ncbi:MAG: hypothetical protein HKN33_08405 [Pyrinomonadaceae bacterium]|nr:hypothetical protein [Pyrinomonadaceae bacterium]